jgi:Rrf2 family nitric oxide-sensitive transcriptional repressor
MQFTVFSDYSLRVLMHAALRAPKRVTIDEVAGAFGISRNHLVKVVHGLSKSGHLATRRGIGGGFTLAVPAEQIMLGRVVRLTEEEETVISCKDRNNRLCRIFPACRLRGVLDEAAAAFFAVLDGYSLKDLMQQTSEMKKLLKITLKA